MVDDEAPTDVMASGETLSQSRALELDVTHATPIRPGTGQLPARYRLAGSLGHGGMGEVLLATDTQIDREVAIKRMLIEPSAPAVARSSMATSGCTPTRSRHTAAAGAHRVRILLRDDHAGQRARLAQARVQRTRRIAAVELQAWQLRQLVHS